MIADCEDCLMPYDSSQSAETNRDLELFAWNICHDLRTPLRAVSAFLHIFREENDPKLDGRARYLLDRMDGGCVRIEDLIDGLKRLSSLTRMELRREPVNLSAVAMSVVLELQGIDPGRAVDIHVEPVLIEAADRALVIIALENLIGNAWKFTKKTAYPMIRVGRTAPSEGGWFYVRDNGIGFDVADAPSLFTPFERFHSREEFEGSGIGLATVEKIVLRHGGKIRVEAKPGNGATFYFTLAPEPGC